MKIFRRMSKWLGQTAVAAGLLLATTLAAAQTVTYFHNDPSGTPVMATDAAGNVVWKENYRPYGERLNNPAAEANNRIGYAGKPFDPSTGLSYMGARYYDPVLGRFMGVDPAPPRLDNLHSINRYAYANNNPYKYVDPDGRMAVPAVFIATTVLFIGATKYANDPQARAVVDRAFRAIANVFHSESTSTQDPAKPPAPPEADKPNLLDPKGEQHVLDGDGPNKGGGHRAGTGKPGKSEFPSGWSDDRIKGEISDVATDPGSSRTPGQRGRTVVQGTRGGIDITVVVEGNGRIVTGFPTNVPRNPKP